MEHCDLIIAPRWLVTVDGSNRVLDDAVVAVTDGRIIEVLFQGGGE